ncbi:MAG TPA: GNAT family N-acetyltransferase [Methyloceanibacter sp.]
MGWRLCRSAWGNGFATEAAKEALTDAFARRDFDLVLAITSITNQRSEAVVRRLEAIRRTDLDFEHPDDFTGPCLVYAATGTKCSHSSLPTLSGRHPRPT